MIFAKRDNLPGSLVLQVPDAALNAPADLIHGIVELPVPPRSLLAA